MLKFNPGFTSNTLVQRVENKTDNQGSSNTNALAFEKGEKKSRPYNDPLMKWPIRGLAFTNDIGAAVMDIAPKAGTLLWYPAMMYFGADIYDKYRNNKETYDPNAQRGVQQAIFQALASVVFPIAAVHTGQKGASILARKSDTKLSLQTQEESTKFLLDFMSRRKLGKYDADINKFKEEFKLSLNNYIDETTRKHQNTNMFKKIFNLIFGGRHPEEMGKEGMDRQSLIHKYTESQIDDVFSIRADLLKDETKKPAKMSEKLYTEFKTLKAKYLKDSELKTKATDLAIKDVVNKFENSKIFKTKLKKTLGGFVVLGLLIKPIDIFVEKVLMKKYVEPGLDYIANNQIKNFKQKNMNR